MKLERERRKKTELQLVFFGQELLGQKGRQEEPDRIFCGRLMFWTTKIGYNVRNVDLFSEVFFF